MVTTCGGFRVEDGSGDPILDAVIRQRHDLESIPRSRKKTSSAPSSNEAPAGPLPDQSGSIPNVGKRADATISERVNPVTDAMDGRKTAVVAEWQVAVARRRSRSFAIETCVLRDGPAA